MPETPRFYRLRVRNAADSADLLVVTSVRGGTAPYIAGPPSGDGQSFIPLTGETATGSYRLLVVDEGVSANAVTSVLADVNARQQLLSKRAFLESSPDGTTWTSYVPGYCNAVRLVTPGKYEFAVGDSRRQEVSTDVFKSVLLKRGAKSSTGMPGAPTFTRFPNATMLIGGPVKTPFWSAKDNGGWQVKVSQVTGAGAAAYVQLKVQSYGWFDPRDPGLGVNEFPSKEFINHLNEETQPYWWRSPNWVASTIQGLFPDLYYRVESTTGTLVGYFTPISEPKGVDVKREDYLTRPNQSSFWVAWTQSLQPGGGTVAAPSVGAEYRLYLFASDVSEKNPLHAEGHPLDIREKAWLDADIPYNAAALASTRAAIGNELYIGLRPTHSSKLNELEKVLDGLFGTATRINSAGERVLFTTRIKDSAAPSLTVTLADLRSWEGTGWEIDEQTVSNRITFKQQRFGSWVVDGTGTPPADGLYIGLDTVIEDYGGATTPGDHETVYDLEGRLVNPADQEYFIRGVAGEAFDRYGQGAISGELHCLPSMTAQLGEEIILNLPHLPNAITGRSPVSQRGGARIVQIVQRTETPSGPDIRWIDAGTSVQSTTAPTFTLTANAIDGRKFADLAVTNAGALAAAGAKVRIEIATGAGAPTSGTLLTVLDPAVLSSMTLPAFDAGTKVWIRMRSEITGNRPSAWTAFTGLQLTVLDPVTSLAVAAQGADISRRLLTWVVGTNASDIPVEVYLRLTADPSTADRLLITLPAGSTQYELIGLDVANRTATVRHREVPPAAGISASTTVAVNTTGTAATLNPPTDPVGFSGPVVWVGNFTSPSVSASKQGTFGIDVTATEFPSSIEVFMKVGGGAYASAGFVESLLGQRTRFVTSAPNDGQTRTLKARHVRAGMTASAFTAEVLITNPWSPSATMYQSGDVVGLLMRARVTATAPTTVTVRVATADPFPQGAASVSIATQELGTGAATTPASPQTTTPAATITEAAGTYVDYTVTRSAFGSGAGRVTFTATAPNRQSAFAAVDVPPIDRDTQALSMRLLRISESATQVVIRAEVISPNAGATVTIVYDNGGLTVSPSSGGTLTSTSDFATTAHIDYTITKDVVGGTPRRVTFTASASGYIDTTDGIDVPPAVVASITLSIGTCTASNAGAGGPPWNQLSIPWSVSGMPSGVTYDITYDNGVSGGSGSITGLVIGDSPKVFTSVTFAASPGRGVVTILAQLGGVTIATKKSSVLYAT